jgi:hypothetical protein
MTGRVCRLPRAFLHGAEPQGAREGGAHYRHLPPGVNARDLRQLHAPRRSACGTDRREQRQQALGEGDRGRAGREGHHRERGGEARCLRCAALSLALRRHSLLADCVSGAQKLLRDADRDGNGLIDYDVSALPRHHTLPPCPCPTRADSRRWCAWLAGVHGRLGRPGDRDGCRPVSQAHGGHQRWGARASPALPRAHSRLLAELTRPAAAPAPQPAKKSSSWFCCSSPEGQVDDPSRS